MCLTCRVLLLQFFTLPADGVDTKGLTNLIPKPWRPENGATGLRAGIVVRVLSTDTKGPPRVCSSPPHFDRQGWTIGYPLTGLPLVAHVSLPRSAEEVKALKAATRELEDEEVRSFQHAMLGSDESGAIVADGPQLPLAHSLTASCSQSLPP